MRQTIHVVPHQHFDLVWRRESQWYRQRRSELYNQIFTLLEQEADATYTLSQAMPLREFLDKNPEMKVKITKFLKEKRLEIIGGSESIPDVNMPSPAAVMWNIFSGKDYFKQEFNYDVKVGAFEDAFGVPAQLPEIINLGGYEFYKAGRMPRQNGKANLSGNYIWKSKGGKMIRCISPLPLNSDWGWGYQDNPDDPTETTCEERKEKVLNRLINAASTNENHVLYSVMGEEHDLIDDLPGLLKKASNATGADYCFSTYTKYYKQLTESYWESVPIYDDKTDLSRLFTGCYTSRVDSKLHPRELEYQLLADNFSSAAGNQDTNFEIKQNLFWLQFHDSICGCHIDENADFLDKKHKSALEAICLRNLQLPFPRQLPEFKHETVEEIDRNFSSMKWGDFEFLAAENALQRISYKGVVFGHGCEITAREDNGTLWTEDYTGNKLEFSGQETIQKIEKSEHYLRLTTKFLFDDFLNAWPGMSRLTAVKRLTFDKRNGFIKVEIDIDWLGSATEISVRWNFTGNRLRECLAEVPLGSMKRKSFAPARDTMTGAAFPVLNWCGTEQATVYNRGTAGHAIREGYLETILLRSPVKRWSPWFPVTPSDESRDNGLRSFSFMIDLNNNIQGIADRHRAGMEYNLPEECEYAGIDKLANIPSNLVIADLQKIDDSRLKILVFEAEEQSVNWSDEANSINEYFKPFEAKYIYV